MTILGVAFATGLAEAGADIAICARREDRLQATREQVETLGSRRGAKRRRGLRTVLQSPVRCRFSRAKHVY